MSLVDLFPGLLGTTYEITSPSTDHYNCITWAAGDSSLWWWPGQYQYWPEGIPRDESLDAFKMAYSLLGYKVCEDDTLEAGFEKIAIYELNHKPTHAARQLRSGLWTSKLGESFDISHEFLALEGEMYGRVVMLMKRTDPREVQRKSVGQKSRQDAFKALKSKARKKQSRKDRRHKRQ